MFALDKTATSCNVRATVKNLPDHCSAANPTNVVTANLADDATSDGIVFVDVVITCEQPVAEAPAVEVPVVDDGGDMGGDDDGGDMGGDDDGGDMGGDDDGGDMGGDDDGDGDMGGDDDGGRHGPGPVDTPTG